jgi:hypothetical protein
LFWSLMTIGKPVPAAVDRLLMMGKRMPETCWAVSKLQAINLLLIAASSWLNHLKEIFSLLGCYAALIGNYLSMFWDKLRDR